MKYINNIWTGDRYIDHALNLWATWYGDKYKLTDVLDDLTDVQMDEIYYDGLDKFVEFVFENFPLCSDTPNCDYDVPSTWELFKDESKANYNFTEELVQYLNDLVKVDNSVVMEYIDDDLICECYSGSDKLDDFFKKNKIGKQLSAKDRKAFKTAFEEGVCVGFENGYSWCPSEFADVVMSFNDDEGHTVKDLHDYVNKHKNDDDKFVCDCEIYNSRLSNMFGGQDIYTCWQINFEDIAYHALNN